MIADTLNSLSRLVNKVVMLVLAVLIFLLLLSRGFIPNTLPTAVSALLLTLWILFTLVALTYVINGLLLLRGFNEQVKTYQNKGKPVRGIRGFDDLVVNLKSAFNYSVLIFLASFISLILYILVVNDLLASVAQPDDEDAFNSFVTTLAITFAFISISVTFIVEFPEQSSFDPGGLVTFYEPDVFPLTIDNLLGDVFRTYIDPITFMEIDEWYQDIGSKLVADYEADESQRTRLERAVERILLVTYLNISTPDLVTDDVVLKEFKELFGENVDEFMNGEGTGLTFAELKFVIRSIESQAPEPFRLVDRLLLSLTDNYDEFTHSDTYFTVSARTTQGSVRESTGVIVYLLNNTPNEGRSFRISMNADMHTVHPSSQSFEITLDPQTDPFPEVQPEVISDGDDILGILADILQVGDAIWFRMKTSTFGYKVVTVSVSEVGGGYAAGRSLEIKFTKGLSFYVKAYLPRISGLAGIALPVLQSAIGLGS